MLNYTTCTHRNILIWSRGERSQYPKPPGGTSPGPLSWLVGMDAATPLILWIVSSMKVLVSTISRPLARDWLKHKERGGSVGPCSASYASAGSSHTAVRTPLLWLAPLRVLPLLWLAVCKLANPNMFILAIISVYPISATSIQLAVEFWGSVQMR